MKCKDLMTKKLIVGHVDNNILDISILMNKNNIGLIPIVYDNSNKLAGVVTDRDIINRALAKNKSINENIMITVTRQLITVEPDDDITIAISKMADFQIKRILVTNGETLIGIISLHDLAINNYTNKYINELVKEISIPNPQVTKPLQFLKVDDFPL